MSCCRSSDLRSGASERPAPLRRRRRRSPTPRWRGHRDPRSSRSSPRFPGRPRLSLAACEADRALHIPAAGDGPPVREDGKGPPRLADLSDGAANRGKCDAAQARRKARIRVRAKQAAKAAPATPRSLPRDTPAGDPGELARYGCLTPSYNILYSADRTPHYLVCTSAAGLTRSDAPPRRGKPVRFRRCPATVKARVPAALVEPEPSRQGRR